jgi:2-polyprenyl-6-hydroxyphenyl methylase / 3-demethylubiquinone-9 3-methyltransferase
MNTAHNADPAELAKFNALAHGFWDPHGPLRTLHALNPVRVDFIAARSALADLRVADIGCGGGILAESLASRGARVTAIDLAPAMIEVAQLHAQESGARIDYRQCDAAALAAAEPGAFDVVTCMELIEHVPDPAALISALGQLLRPAGTLYISTINRSAKSFALAIVAAEYVLGRAVRMSTRAWCVRRNWRAWPARQVWCSRIWPDSTTTRSLAAVRSMRIRM